MEERDRFANKRWLTRVSTDMDGESGSSSRDRESVLEREWECLEDEPDEPWLRRNEAAEDAAMVMTDGACDGLRQWEQQQQRRNGSWHYDDVASTVPMAT